MLRELAIALAAVCVMAAQPARGEELVLAAADGPRDSDRLPAMSPVWLDLIVNQVSGGTVLVQLGEGDAWVAEEDLAVVKVDVAGIGERVGVAGRSLVSLRSLAPRVTFELDERALALRVTVAETLLGHTAVDVRGRQRPDGLRTRVDPSAFLNWGAVAGTGDARSASTELGLTYDSALLLNGATMDASGRATRGLTTAYRDDASALVRYAAGDVVASSWDPLGGVVLLGGVAAWREFSLDPYLVLAPLPRTSVFASTPSTLEVWVNDRIVKRIPVAPGTVDLENLPIVAGANEVRTVVRDAFGREQVGTTTAIMGSAHLAPGLVDWGGYAGFRRQSFGRLSFDYGEPAAVGQARAGLTPALTLGGRLEGAEGLVSAGVSAAFVSSLGEWDCSLATSGGAGGAGGALDLRWRQRRRSFTLGAELKLQSPTYANVALSPGQDRPAVRVSAQASARVASRTTLILEAGVDRWRDTAEPRARGALRVLWGIARGYQLGLSMTRSDVRGQGEASWGIFTSLVAQLPDGATGEASASASSSGSRTQVAASRSLGLGPGIGYRVLASAGELATASASVQAQGGPGRVELRYEALEPWRGDRRSYGAAAEASGGLVLIRGKVFATTPVNGSYAVVSVPGVKGVTAYLDHHEVGRTDGDGDLLVSGLRANLANKLSIRDADVPMEYRVNEVERVVAPAFRGGTVERFDVEAMRAITGKLRLRIESGTVVPEWGEVAVEAPGKRIVSPIGTDGAFWLDELPAGTVEALVRWEGRLCRLSFTVPVAAGVSDVGTVECNQLLAQLGGSVAAR